MSQNIQDIGRLIMLRSEWPVMLPSDKIAYVPVPKNACTSMKEFVYASRFQTQFQSIPLIGRRYLHIHNHMPCRLFNERKLRAIKQNGWSTFAIVRNPLDRFISSYCNRVLFHRDLEKTKLKLNLLGLPSRPDINQFIEFLDAYRKVNRLIRHHTESQVTFLGCDPSLYTVLIPPAKISYLGDIFGGAYANASLPRLQEGGKEFQEQAYSDLSRINRDCIISRYSSDYDCYSRYFA